MNNVYIFGVWNITYCYCFIWTPVVFSGGIFRRGRFSLNFLKSLNQLSLYWAMFLVISNFILILWMRRHFERRFFEALQQPNRHTIDNGRGNVFCKNWQSCPNNLWTTLHMCLRIRSTCTVLYEAASYQPDQVVNLIT